MKRFFGTLLGLVLAFGVGAIIYNSVRDTNGKYHSASNEAHRIRTNTVDRLPTSSTRNFNANNDRTNSTNFNAYNYDGTMRAKNLNNVDLNPLNDWLRQMYPGTGNYYTGNNGNTTGNAGNYYGGAGNTGNTGNTANTGNTGYTGNTGNYNRNTGTGTNAGAGAGTAANSDFANQILAKVNAERAKAGVQALTLNAALNKVAQAKSADMRDKGYFDHQSPTYGSPFDMMKSFGVNYSYAGENIAAGQQSVDAVMTAWMNSPGHRQNILSANYTQLGVGYAQGGSMSPYWTQEFTRP
ncbi:SCP-like extracellular [Paenibacillus lycopersici]|uniref:SCP-like extracellular n=1 Tax=Paenibacillus lycopersici TaxID=2704462 RepID=A0A6C0G4V4_9BACL|nr:CAP domain-containing protein [Paenibacillus lycopersici]QHT59985.1 SCP-like extracellular [Paenibacillus lycopersici]